MDVMQIIEAITELQEANRAYDWAKPKGGAQYRLQRAITVVGHILDGYQPGTVNAASLKLAAEYQKESADWYKLARIQMDHGQHAPAIIAQDRGASRAKEARKLMGVM